MRVVFESNVSDPVLFTSRIPLWKAAGFDTVAFHVDDSSGATWPSSLIPQDSRYSPSKLKDCIDLLHSNGMAAWLVFATNLWSPWTRESIRPEFLVGGWSQPGYVYRMYNPWLPSYREWKSDVIAECASKTTADAIILDYFRTGRYAQAGEEPADVVMRSLLSSIRSKVPAWYNLITCTPWVLNASEGVDVVAWKDLTELSMVFNYSPTFDPAPLMPIQHRVVPITGNYKIVAGSAVALSGEDVARNWRQLTRRLNPPGLGVYLANMLNDEQAKALSAVGFVSVQ